MTQRVNVTQRVTVTLVTVVTTVTDLKKHPVTVVTGLNGQKGPKMTPK